MIRWTFFLFLSKTVLVNYVTYKCGNLGSFDEVASTGVLVNLAFSSSVHLPLKLVHHSAHLKAESTSC